MSFNGSGSFLINTAGQPVVSGTVISSTAFNALTADLATGLSTCITKDGQTTVTANIPMANYKFTGLGAGSGAADSANLSQVQSTVVKLLASVSGTDTITAVGSPTVAAYAAGQMFYFVAAGDNTGAVTINIDSLGAKAVTRDGSVALAAGDIKSGEVVVVVYDGTRFQVVSQINSSGNATFANVSITSALNVGGVATFTGGTANGVTYLNGSKELTSGSALQFSGTNLSLGAAVTSSTWGQFVGVQATYPGVVLSSTASGGKKWSIGADAAVLTFRNETDSTTAAVIDGSNNVGIGTSSPSVKLHVSATDSTGVSAIRLQNTTATTGKSWQITSSNSGVLQLATIPGVADYLTMSSSGNLMVGGTTAESKLNVYSGGSTFSSGTMPAGMTIFGNTNDGQGSMLSFKADSGSQGIAGIAGVRSNGYQTELRFYTNNTNSQDAFAERARITAAGEFLVGKTAVGTGTAGAEFGDSGYVRFLRSSSTTDTTLDVYSIGAAAYRFYVQMNGTIFATVTTISGISDQRVKENIRDLDAGLDAVMALKPRKFDWKEGKGKNIKNDRGFIAQEFEQVFPDLIDTWKDPAPEGEEPYKSVRQDLIPVLVKAIQELKAELDAAKVKIAALEAK